MASTSDGLLSSEVLIVDRANSPFILDNHNGPLDIPGGLLNRRSTNDELVHSNASLKDFREESWMTHPLGIFTDKIQGNEVLKDRKMPSNVREFYRKQNKLIREFQEVDENLGDEDVVENEMKGRKRALLIGKRMGAATFVCNVILLIAKAFAVYLSGSLSVISSLVDSCVDISSGIVIFWTNKMVANRNPYMYPQGRTRLEPIAIIILSALMGSAALQLVREGIQSIVSMATKKYKGPQIQSGTFELLGFAVGIKVFLLVICYVYGNRLKRHTKTLLVLAQDHRNDVITNSLILICTIVTKYYPPAKYCDPIGAIGVGIFILVGWWQTGREHIRSLSGITADARFIQKLTFISLNHDRQIKCIDTVRAFYHGSFIFVEVDIVLPGSMKLREAHDIGESLQVKLEALNEVERAFVHLDYESCHDPKSEHKQV